MVNVQIELLMYQVFVSPYLGISPLPVHLVFLGGGGDTGKNV